MLFDDILRDLGEFGTCQIVYYFLFGLLFLGTAWQTMGITFIGGDMDHWCKVEALENFTVAEQRDIAIPFRENSTTVYKQCEMYDLDFSSYSQEDLSTWDRSIFVTNYTNTILCTDWVYDKSTFYSSIVSQWDLVCGNLPLVSLVQTVYFLGYLIGCVGYGQLSDKFGRMKAISISLFTWVLFGLTGAFMPYYAVFVIFRFLLGTSVAGAFNTGFVYCMEIIGPRYRTVTGIMIHMWFAVGIMLGAAIAYLIRDHVILQIVLSAYVIICWSIIWIIPESPRWLVAVGRDEEATKILYKIARRNYTSLKDKLNLAENRVGNREGGKGATIVDLIRSPPMLIIALNIWFCWFATSLGYYGLNLGVTVLGGSIYVNSFLSGLVEALSCFIAMAFLQCVGRRWPTLFTVLAMGLCCFICMALLANPEYKIALTMFLMCGKSLAGATFAILHVYVAELFPTTLRNLGIGMASAWARAGSLIQPQIGHLGDNWPPAHYLVYGIFATIAGVWTFFLPETHRHKLPETLEEAEYWKKQKPKRHPIEDPEAKHIEDKIEEETALVEQDNNRQEPPEGSSLKKTDDEFALRDDQDHVDESNPTKDLPEEITTEASVEKSPTD